MFITLYPFLKEKGVMLLLLLFLPFYQGSSSNLDAQGQPQPPYKINRFPCTLLNPEKQVYDGDTITNVLIQIKAMDFSGTPKEELGNIWPTFTLASDGIYTRNSIRLRGVDTPEKHPKKANRTEQSIANEKKAAMNARAAVLSLLAANDYNFTVTNIELGKYGRVVADVHIGNINVSEFLINQNLGLPYEGGTKAALNWEELDKGYVK